MSTDLLDQQRLLSLAKSPSEKAFTEELKGTLYGDSVEGLSPEASAVDYEKAFYTVFLQRVDRVVKMAPKGFEPFLTTYFPVRLEITNIKRILRGKYAGQPEEEMEKILLPVSPQGVKDFNGLLKADGVEGVVNTLSGTMYASLLSRLPIFKELGSLWALEVELNYVYFDAISGAIGRAISKYRDFLIRLVEVEQSVENLLLALSIPSGSKSIDASPEPMLERSRLIPAEIVKQLVGGGDVSSILSRLQAPVSEIISPLSTNDAAMVRTRLQRYLLETVGRVARTDAMDFPYPLWFLMRCEAEVKDLARIAWCLDQGLSYEQFSQYFLLL
jgi:vacuolar-type H+-ATPase subunit C/Vma6